ncbi:hypothetical protein LTR64_000681 [Lithohypha guttulata]|uniref:Uncharacterized protein n=1 Tax=Lithohypha guttulata TaxID=1690604 RepID=A0AAN7T2D6_9EURO|nr:hypothetical protein LTR51_005550 [Lithohypha guttulata]KAK5086697.1 hypothetical protein LTR05_003865 [Lithohypha guttulata]
MPGAVAKGAIIIASVLVAASIAAYENPQIREWFERSSQKVALAFRSLGDDIQEQRKRRRSNKQDSSMHEDMDEKAEERRRQARQEIMDRGRRLQAKREGRRSSMDKTRTPSFDSIVDDDGKLRPHVAEAEQNPWAASTAVEQNDSQGLRSRTEHPRMHDSVDSPILLRQLDPDHRPMPVVSAIEPWESQYEQEMRNAWNIDLTSRSAGVEIANSHASESLIDLTPTTEEFPDPDYSIPSLTDTPYPLSRSEYFSVANSQALQEDEGLNGDHVVLRRPLTSLDPRPFTPPQNLSAMPSYHTSLAGSTSHIGHREAEVTEDDMSDEEYGDGIRTPASAWTEVGSSVSGDERP